MNIRKAEFDADKKLCEWLKSAVLNEQAATHCQKRTTISSMDGIPKGIEPT
jgi:hypothetical protein